jgi:hypothetical protein
MADHRHDAYDVYDVAREHHRHYDLEDLIEGLRADLNHARERISQLEDDFHDHDQSVPHG